MTRVPVTALVITKNEARAIAPCLSSLQFCDQVIVVDSDSEDGTVEIAEAWGAEVVNFLWDGKYPKKKQWAMDLPQVRNTWVLHIDADEVVTPELGREIARALASQEEAVAYNVPLRYRFMSRELRYGHRVTKRSLINREYCVFPVVDDLSAPGIGEVEGHYQPVANGAVKRLKSSLLHDDPDLLDDWISRHNRYSSWEAYLAAHPTSRSQVRKYRSGGGRLFDAIPGKPLTFFVYSYILRLGFLDGRAGFDYAFALAWYYWSISAKVRER